VRRAFSSFAVWCSGLGVASSAALAQPVPVVVSQSQGRTPPSDRLAAILRLAGPEARGGADLARDLTQRFGRFAPQDDILRAQRREVDAGVQAYFGNGGPRESRRRLTAAIQPMEAAREALELREDNRASYLRALVMLGRIALEEHDGTTADAWFRRAITFDPPWTPSTSDHPPPVVTRYQQLRPAPSRETNAAPVALRVRAPREGCTVTVDGRALAGTAAEQTVSVAPGEHRVVVNCGQPSRVRAVAVSSREATVAVDPRFDTALQLTGAPSLNYASARDDDDFLVGDAATLGASLDARRVLVVDADAVHVIDVVARREVSAIPLQASDLGPRVRAALTAPVPADAPPTVTPHPPAGEAPSRGPGVAPWLVVGLGGAAAIAGGVLLGVSVSNARAALAMCPAEGCTEDSLAQVEGPYDDARLLHTVGITALAAGGVLVVGGLVWYFVAPRGTASARRALPWRVGWARGGPSVDWMVSF
jgi:hypothetical protein